MINTPSLSPASQQLGLGSSSAEQAAGETEAERRRRLAAIASSTARLGALSPAGMVLFGGGLNAAA
jgi:hypothetical protein